MKKIFLCIGLTILGVAIYARHRPNHSQIKKVTSSKNPMDIIISEDDRFDVEVKRKKVINLVERGINYLKKHSLEDACNKFTHSKEFVDGELYIFLYDFNGDNLAHGNQFNLIWQNLIGLRGKFGKLIVQKMLHAKKGGGWLNYIWNNATKVSYVKEVEKDGKSYLIGSGYYPHSKKAGVVTLVKAAVSLLEETIQNGSPVEWAFSQMNYSRGFFLEGDLILFAYDEKGTVLVQADNPSLVGINNWNWKDKTGKYVTQEMIKKATESDEGVWINYVYKNAPKISYMQKVKDKKGNLFFIGCGYWPNIGRDNAVELVTKGITFIKSEDLEKAINVFNDKLNMQFRFGPLYLFIFTSKGKCLAHGENIELMGKNLYDAQDLAGRYYVREYIEKAKAGGGWVNANLKNTIQSTYVQQIEIEGKTLIIGTSLFPISKHALMLLLVESGTSYLLKHSIGEAFDQFIQSKGSFYRGDLHLFAFDETGICYCYGDDTDLIWRNLIGLKDDDGRPFVKLLINKGMQEPSIVRYKLNGANKVAYVASVKKDGQIYILGSSYYE